MKEHFDSREDSTLPLVTIILTASLSTRRYGIYKRVLGIVGKCGETFKYKAEQLLIIIYQNICGINISS